MRSSSTSWRRRGIGGWRRRRRRYSRQAHLIVCARRPADKLSDFIELLRAVGSAVRTGSFGGLPPILGGLLPLLSPPPLQSLVLPCSVGHRLAAIPRTGDGIPVVGWPTAGGKQK